MLKGEEGDVMQALNTSKQTEAVGSLYKRLE